MTRIAHCRRCDARDVEGPDGSSIWNSRTLFGPFVARDLCARCFSIEIWVKWRFLTTLASVVLAGHSAWVGRWLAVAGTIAGGAIWWRISTLFIRARSDG